MFHSIDPAPMRRAGTRDQPRARPAPEVQEAAPSLDEPERAMEGEGRHSPAALAATRGALYGLRWPLAIALVLILSALLWEAMA